MKKLLLTLFFVALSVAGEINISLISKNDNSKILNGSVVVDNKFFESNFDGVITIPEEYKNSTLKIKAPGFVKGEFTLDEDNKIVLEEFYPKALYVSYWAAGNKKYMSNLIKEIKGTSINALVIDIKNEYGDIQFKSDSDLAKKNKVHYNRTIKDLQGFVEDLKKENIYLIARMVVFKDDKIAKKNVDLAIVDQMGFLWENREKLGWVDPFSDNIHTYNIDLAEDVAKLGFDEIQFDYIRFPTYKNLRFGQINNYKNRVNAISSFLKSAKERLSLHNVFLSADVFGYACINDDDIGIGQDLSVISKYVDIIAPMVYPSGYTYLNEIRGNPVAKPKETVYYSLLNAQQKKNINPKKLRPWLQAFRDYSYDKRKYGKEEIDAQIAGAEESGSSGWMLWHPSSRYNLDMLD